MKQITKKKSNVRKKVTVRKKKSTKFKGILIIIITVIIYCGTIFYLLDGDYGVFGDLFQISGSSMAVGNVTSTASNINNDDEYEYDNNILISSAVYKNKLIVFATNNNKVDVDMDIYTTFYDSNDNLVGEDFEGVKAIAVGATTAYKIYDTPDSWDHYEITIHYKKTKYTSYFDKISITHSLEDTCINIKIINNSDDRAYIDVAAVYYQGKEIVRFDDITDVVVDPGFSERLESYFPVDDNGNNIPFDNYKVIITQAYSG